MQTVLFSVTFFQEVHFHGRFRDGIIAGKASAGRSAGTESGERTQSKDTETDSGGCDSGKSITSDNADDLGTVGDVFMRSIQSGKVSWSVPGNRGAFFSPRRTHLLTTAPKGAAVVLPSADVRSPRGMRLLREPMDNATLPWEALSLSTQLAAALQGSIRQLPAQTCHRQLCPQLWVSPPRCPFSFSEKETKTRTKGR